MYDIFVILVIFQFIIDHMIYFIRFSRRIWWNYYVWVHKSTLPLIIGR